MFGFRVRARVSTSGGQRSNPRSRNRQAIEDERKKKEAEDAKKKAVEDAKKKAAEDAKNAAANAPAPVINKAAEPMEKESVPHTSDEAAKLCHEAEVPL